MARGLSFVKRAKHEGFPNVIPDARFARDWESRKTNYSSRCSGFPIGLSACRE
jgi:hypothetical protein